MATMGWGAAQLRLVFIVGRMKWRSRPRPPVQNNHIVDDARGILIKRGRH